MEKKYFTIEKLYFLEIRRCVKNMLEVKTYDMSFKGKLKKWGWYRTRLISYIDIGFYTGIISLNTWKILFNNTMNLRLTD